MRQMYKILIFCLLIFFPLIIFAQAEDLSSKAGFSPGPIWFSKYPVYVEDQIKVYTALYNNSQYNISGEVHFFNKEKLIGKASFEMPPNSGNKDVSIGWTAEKGELEIGAEIKSVAITDTKGDIILNIDLNERQLTKNNLVVDYNNFQEDEAGEKEKVSDINMNLKLDSTEDNVNEASNTDEKNLLDKIDDSVMGFLNKVTKNKLDEYVDNISEEQVQKLEVKKEELSDKLKDNLENSLIKLETSKSTTTNGDGAENKSSQTVTPKEADNSQIKSKISLFFQNFISKAYLVIINTLIFFLNHKIFLFLLIFLVIYMLIKKIIKFFLG